mgnify:CR=1 FL=1
MSTLRNPWLFFAALALAGCATELPQLPPADLPSEWQGERNSSAQWPEADWWQRFETPELVQLLEQVRANNIDLANNRRNLQIAQLTLTGAGFDLWPSPSVTLSHSGSRTGGSDIDTANSQSATLSGGLVYNGILGRPTQYDRARAEFASTRAAIVDAALATYCTASNAYFQLLLIRDQIAAAEKNLDNAQTILAIAESRVNAGADTPLEALQQRIAVEKQRNNLRNLQQDELAARASLALLAGTGLADFGVEGQSLERVAVPDIGAGVPSDLLLRRPDLVQAEAQLRSSRADVDLARLAYLPDIGLTATGNSASDALDALLSAPATTVTASASLVQSLLDNGARRRATEQSRLRLENALADYRNAVLGALNEVEIALGNIALREAQAQVAADDLARAEEAFRIARVRYSAGADGYQALIDTQNTLFEARTSYLQNKFNRLNSLIGLYQALGGGWRSGDDGATDALLAPAPQT